MGLADGFHGFLPSYGDRDHDTRIEYCILEGQDRHEFGHILPIVRLIVFVYRNDRHEFALLYCGIGHQKIFKHISVDNFGNVWFYNAFEGQLSFHWLEYCQMAGLGGK